MSEPSSHTIRGAFYDATIETTPAGDAAVIKAWMVEHFRQFLPPSLRSSLKVTP